MTLLVMLLVILVLLVMLLLLPSCNIAAAAACASYATLLLLLMLLLMLLLLLCLQAVGKLNTCRWLEMDRLLVRALTARHLCVFFPQCSHCVRRVQRVVGWCVEC